MEPRFDRIIKNARVVRPGGGPAPRSTVDIAIAGEKIAAVAPQIDPQSAKQVDDARSLLAFPGVVDAHMHVGIYHPLEEDAFRESIAAAAGGVTSSINYMRTGQYYLNRGGPYHEFFPEVLRQSSGRFHVDYAYHLAPISRGHIKEMESLVSEYGVTSFKIFMFYGSHGLHGRSNSQNGFLMIDDDERYDIAHFEFVMRELARLRRERQDWHDGLSLSLHCELGEILTAYTKIVEGDPSMTGLRAYSASRPPHSEGLAVWIASYLAHETECPNINLLHLSSAKAIEAAITMKRVLQHVNFRREVTVGHLLMDYDSAAGNTAKVNPPIRSREDVERLWRAVLEGDVDWVCSDHACCSHEKKIDPKQPDNVFAAKSGFGGTDYLLSGLFSEGTRRGLDAGRIADLLCRAPAQRYGLVSKGDIDVGMDADVVLFDPDETFVVRGKESLSGQGYTPFEGMELTGRVKTTYLRGEKIWGGGRVLGAPRGRYINRLDGLRAGPPKPTRGAGR